MALLVSGTHDSHECTQVLFQEHLAASSYACPTCLLRRFCVPLIHPNSRQGTHSLHAATCQAGRQTQSRAAQLPCQGTMLLQLHALVAGLHWKTAYMGLHSVCIVIATIRILLHAVTNVNACLHTEGNLRT